MSTILDALKKIEAHLTGEGEKDGASATLTLDNPDVAEYDEQKSVAELEEELAAAESSIESLKELLYCRNRAVLRAGGQIAELANSVESLNKELETERARASALEQELRASKGG